MSKPGEWIENDGARAQFLRLAQDSGIFLENRLAELANSFAKDFTKRKGVRVSAESIAYGRDTTDSPLRQIDQRVQFYKEFVLDERTGIQLIMSLPIEAKYRRDVETCAIRYPEGFYRPAFPLVSGLQGSSLGSTLRMVNLLADTELCQPVFLEVEKGATPKRVFAENLVFNSAAALYDYIHFDCEGHHGTPMGHSFIEKAKLLERFEKYLAEKHYYWPQVIRDWMGRNLTPTLVTEFNRHCLPRRCFFSVNVYVPVLFVNGPIHALVESTKKGTQFERRDLIMTRVRVPGWPGKLRRDLLGYTAEAPLLITNENGINDLLTGCHDGFLAFENILKRARSTFAIRWPIEAAFYQMALQRLLSEEDSSLRSDVDFFQWLHPVSYESD